MRVSHVRIYPLTEGGFEVMARVRGGLQRAGVYPTIDVALDSTRTLNLKNPDDCVFVYPRPFADSLARHMIKKIAKVVGA